MLAYVVYKDLYSPDEVLEKMYDYLKNKAFDFALDLTDDLDIYNKKENDGKKFTVYNRTGEYFLNFRSANGINIFGPTHYPCRLLRFSCRCRHDKNGR